ncbi:transmembrane protein 180 [Strigomonas culicis]|uniref:Transmembrane protein 180 n=1 Tax=Strigomonas culicis TaxID=28005 RepID=S9W8U0_9TRYP|nr:transmembrane protein 180 [Strigomonas culicis]|eukprot:EPY35636.1 transmembrane protein 180 [Strigomonas culicis]
MLVVQCLGSVGAGLGSLLYEGGSEHGAEDMLPYRIFCVATAVLVSACFFVVRLPKEPQPLSRDGGASPLANAPSFWRFVHQTMARPSMRCVSIVFAIQECSSTFATTFFSLFLAVVTADLLSYPVRAAVLFLSFLLPHLLVGLDPHVLFFFQAKKVILVCLLLRILVSVAMLLLSVLMRGGLLPAPLYVSAFAALLLANRVLTEVVNALKNEILNDLADEDMVVFGRGTSTIDALRSLMSGIANTCRPLTLALTFAFLSSYDILSRHSFSEQKVSDECRVGIVRLVGYCAAVSSACAAGVWWYMYPLEGKYLQFISSAIKKRTDTQNANSV